MAWFQTATGPLFYEISGTGPPVILLHSLAGTSAMWSDLRAALEGQYTVVAFDARGHGKSAYDAPLSVERQAADAAALLNHLGLTQTVVIGLSMGGRAAMLLADAAPYLVKSLILADTSLGTGGDGTERRLAVVQEIDRLGWQDFVLAYMRSRMNYPQNPGGVAFMHEMLAMKPDRFVEQSVSASRQNVRPQASKIACPCLVIVGDQDRSTPIEMAHALANTLNDSELAILADAGHLSNLDQPAAFAALVSTFLAK